MSQTQQAAGAADPLDPLGYWKSLRDSGMETWSKVMRDFVNSDEYARASAQWLDTYLAMSQPLQRVLDQAMTQTLSQLKMPSVDDITRLAKRLTNIEIRIDDLDARLDEILRLMRALSERKEPIPAGKSTGAAEPTVKEPEKAAAPEEKANGRAGESAPAKVVHKAKPAEREAEAAMKVKSRKAAARSHNGSKSGGSRKERD